MDCQILIPFSSRKCGNVTFCYFRIQSAWTTCVILPMTVHIDQLSTQAACFRPTSTPNIRMQCCGRATKQGGTLALGADCGLDKAEQTPEVRQAFGKELRCFCLWTFLCVVSTSDVVS